MGEYIMFKKSDIDILRKLLDMSGDVELYLCGRSLRNICLGDNQDVMEVTIHDPDRKISRETRESIFKEFSNGKFNILFSFTKEYEYLSEGLTTLDTLRLSVNKLIQSNNGDIQSDANGVKHLIDKEVHITEHGIQSVFKSPERAFEVIHLASKYNLSLSIETMKFIFDCRHLIKDVNRHYVNTFLTQLFYDSHKIRKGVALVNTLGLSMELFGGNLNESSILNHLNKRDILEYFAIIFQNMDPITIDDFLVSKVGFHSVDIKDIVNETRAVLSIEDESDITARRIISTCGKNRVSNLIRLLKLSGYKELSRKLKEQKDAVTSHGELAITLQDVQASFKVTEQEANKLLDLALDRVIVSPELNNQYQLLISLNKDLERVKHG